MKVEDITGHALKKGKEKWWFKLTWGDGYGGMCAVPAGKKYEHCGGLNGRGNKTVIDLNDYDIKIEVKNIKEEK